MTKPTNITRCGLPGIDLVPVGMHACHFYSNGEDLVATLVPYILAGLSAKERCLWITAPPLPAHQAVEALRAAWNGVDDAIRAGALRIHDFDRWYASSVGLTGIDAVELWLEEEKHALAEGYTGLRIAGHTSFVEPGDPATCMEYEQAVSARFDGRRIVALCSYPQTHCDDRQMSEVRHAHHCTFERSDANWRVTGPEYAWAGSPQQFMTHRGFR
jgi:hypothetical protein